MSIFGKNFGPFVLISGLFTLPFLIVSMLAAHPITIEKVTGLAGNSLMSQANIWPYLVPLLQSLASAAVIAGTFMQMNGQRMRTLDAFLASLRRIGPLIGVTILEVLAVGIGLVLLIVPGFIAITMLYVSLPVCICEQRGVTESLNRSSALTRGHRWKVLGIALVTGAISAILGPAIRQLAFKIGGPTAYLLVEYLFQVLYIPFSAIVSVVAYQALRTAKEGPAIGTFAEVFA